MRKRSLLWLLLVINALLVSCVQTDDFELPELPLENIQIDGDLTSIAAVKGNFKPDTGEIHNFSETNTWFEAYVISNDAAGNFYKELIVQDLPENPNAGIHILLDDNSLYETYNFGRKIYVKLDGLSLGYSNGVHQLGIQNRGDIVPIPPSLIDDHIIRSEITSEIKALPIHISDIRPELKNIFVELKDLQFDVNLVRENDIFSFASHRYDRYDGERQMESCSTRETIFLSTSTFSNFRSLLLPTGSGSVKGILSRDYYDEHYVIMVNDPSAIKLDGPRCDVEFLDCGENSDPASQVRFEENFDGVTSNSILTSRKWTNINVSGGEKKFTPTMVNGNRVLRISAYNTLENPLEAWLVSPPIDVYPNRVVEFDILSSFDNGMFLKVFVTTDFTGDPRTTSWIPLDASVPMGPSGRNEDFFKKSQIDLSCVEGKLWIGFKYLGAAPDKTTTYDLDNFSVLSN
ncbi:DUF5689 domain-containing protein [Christiangramia aquimixticola]|uniref:DUF5689 domain-containing protein n=1 Tax=Christiangramia aquimixticola TaxID=1697558 RepID=UPI003AA81950